ncbi:hypothetical protein DXN04_33545 [Chitinophaga silvisoli]|uniref:Uncharacterized protein n=1 Tax=Chitinophaga silvisoli TaxID=2291814 RepID=A0A3E1NMX5_9BACT|nr:hypothetical protein DXN04_33545 [Chitinophaga silvisoli]
MHVVQFLQRWQELRIVTAIAGGQYVRDLLHEILVLKAIETAGFLIMRIILDQCRDMMARWLLSQGCFCGKYFTCWLLSSYSPKGFNSFRELAENYE